MKRFTVFVALLIIFLINITPINSQLEIEPTSNNVVHVIQISDKLWIVEENYPVYIPPQFLVEIYDFLQLHTQPVDENLYAGDVDETPAVIRFVPFASVGCFPESTEGYAGMCERVIWDCDPAPPVDSKVSQYCTFELIDENPQADNVVRYALIKLPDELNIASLQETVGFTIHEMSHLLGTLDGIRCPYHQDYNPTAKLPSDPNDAYWWFGVQGVFGLKPDGIVMLAFNEACDKSDDLMICEQLLDLFHEYLIFTDVEN